MSRRTGGSVCVSTDEAREVYEAQRDQIGSLTLPPARELRDLHKELWIRFGKEETATIRRLTTVQERLKQQKDSLAELDQRQHLGPSLPTNIEKVRYLTKEIQTALKKANAWNKGQLDGLDRSQNSLEEELDVIEKALSKAKIEEESSRVEVSKGPPIDRNQVEKEETEPDPGEEEFPEDFHSWVSRCGGQNGGWTQEDHLHMVTLTHRYANWRRQPERFLEEVWSGVRAVTCREAVRRHVEWWVEYCARRDNQKQRITEWRKNREAANSEERKHSATSQKLHKTNKANWLHKNKEKLRKLEEWKKLKIVKREIEEAEELLRVAEKKAKIEKRMERRNQEIKKYLKIREQKKKFQREKDEEQRRLKEMERRERREWNRLVLSQYHDKDMERIQLKIKQKTEEQARREHLRRVEAERLTRGVQARRELDSLLRRTVASDSREKATREKIETLFPRPGDQNNKQSFMKRRRSLDFGDLAHLDNLPKLASPAWRTLV